METVLLPFYPVEAGILFASEHGWRTRRSRIHHPKLCQLPVFGTLITAALFQHLQSQAIQQSRLVLAGNCQADEELGCPCVQT